MSPAPAFAAAGPERSPRAAALLPALSGVGFVASGLLLLFWPQAALKGWLIGFVFCGSVSMGALAVRLIHRLTGGRWGDAFAPELEPAARALPLLLLFLIPIVVGAVEIFPWAAAPSQLKPQVGLYLNVPFFAGRAVVILGVLALAARSLDRIEAPGGRLLGALALAFYGLAVSVGGIDWILSMKPSFASSDIGMDFAAQQLAGAFAFSALQFRRTASTPPAGDDGGLLFACVIGVIYLIFMSYLVVWYGDRPALDRWYLSRAYGADAYLVLAALGLALCAITLLAFRRRWGTPAVLPVVGALVLAALLAVQTWQIGGDDLGVAALGVLPAVLAQGGALLFLGLRLIAAPADPARPAHGR